MANGRPPTWAAICSRTVASNEGEAVDIGDAVRGQVIGSCRLGALIEVNTASGAELVALLPNSYGGNVLQKGDDVDNVRITSIDAASGRAILEAITPSSAAFSPSFSSMKSFSNPALTTASPSKLSVEGSSSPFDKLRSGIECDSKHCNGRSTATDKQMDGSLINSSKRRLPVELCNGSVPVLTSTDTTAFQEAMITASRAHSLEVEQSVDKTGSESCWMPSSLDVGRFAFLRRWSLAAGFGPMRLSPAPLNGHPCPINGSQSSASNPDTGRKKSSNKIGNKIPSSTLNDNFPMTTMNGSKVQQNEVMPKALSGFSTVQDKGPVSPMNTLRSSQIEVSRQALSNSFPYQRKESGSQLLGKAEDPRQQPSMDPWAGGLRQPYSADIPNASQSKMSRHGSSVRCTSRDRKPRSPRDASASLRSRIPQQASSGSSKSRNKQPPSPRQEEQALPKPMPRSSCTHSIQCGDIVTANKHCPPMTGFIPLVPGMQIEVRYVGRSDFIDERGICFGEVVSDHSKSSKGWFRCTDVAS